MDNRQATGAPGRSPSPRAERRTWSCGRTVTYHRPISLPPDDAASRPERLLDDPLVQPRDPALAPLSLTAVADEARQGMDDQLDELRGQLDDAFNEMADRIDRTEQSLVAFRSAMETHIEARAAADVELAARLVTDRLHLEAALDQLRRDLATWRDAPVTLDTRRLEDAVRQGALHNAADIATMARDVEDLGHAIRRQDTRLSELTTTLDWIKQRILNR